MLKKLRRSVPTVTAQPQLTVGEIDGELAALIGKFSVTPAGDREVRDGLLVRIQKLKNDRFELVRPRQFDRMLAALG